MHKDFFLISFEHVIKLQGLNPKALALLHFQVKSDHISYCATDLFLNQQCLMLLRMSQWRLLGPECLHGCIFFLLFPAILSSPAPNSGSDPGSGIENTATLCMFATQCLLFH